jgi:hypothetical protein
MNEEPDYSQWQARPPWVVFDPDTNAEFVTSETLRYYVVNLHGRWFICDRFPDLRVEGTESGSRSESIRLFYEKHTKRKIPRGWQTPDAVKGTNHAGIG